MLRRSAVLVILCLFTVATLAQNDVPEEATNVARVTIASPGFSYEARTSKNQTFFVHGFLAFGFAVSYSDTFGWYSEFSVDPALTAQYRFYYNGANRAAKGKRTAINSMNYFAPVFNTMYSSRPLTTDYYVVNDRRPINKLGVVWGLQRNYKGHFSIDLNLGPAYLFSTEKVIMDGSEVTLDISRLSAITQLTLAFWLNNKKTRQ
jgi:hypothetical protein